MNDVDRSNRRQQAVTRVDPITGGGTDGHPGQLILETAAGKHLALPSKVPYQKAARGDRLLAYGPSGGGYGNPLRRDPTAVLDNVLDGLISSEIAREHYGVVIANGTVDAAETEKLRQARN